VFAQAVSVGTSGAHSGPQGNPLPVNCTAALRFWGPGTLRPKLLADLNIEEFFVGRMVLHCTQSVGSFNLLYAWSSTVVTLQYCGHIAIVSGKDREHIIGFQGPKSPPLHV
jgi:hypothetical protein